MIAIRINQRKNISLMRTEKRGFSEAQLQLAIERLELFLDPLSQRLLEEIEPRQATHLPELSGVLRQSPFQLKKRLDQLKNAGLVYSPKRYPKAYAVNKMKCVKIYLKARPLAEVG
jgi:predicted transcriptional regulator